jgi:prepilin-type N-terminal cleavage/methylation domain-containing protein
MRYPYKKIYMTGSKMKKNGFTLIELLVSIAILSLSIGAITGIFIAGIRQQRIALVNQELLDQTSFALELMSRALRMAGKELAAPSCLSADGLNYELTRGGSGIKFINVLEGGDCQEFFFEAGQLKYFKQATLQTLPLTSTKLAISSARFNVIGASQGDDIQPRVTLFLQVEGKISGVPKLKIQTTISQRNLDVVF